MARSRTANAAMPPKTPSASASGRIDSSARASSCAVTSKSVKKRSVEFHRRSTAGTSVAPPRSCTPRYTMLPASFTDRVRAGVATM